MLSAQEQKFVDYMAAGKPGYAAYGLAWGRKKPLLTDSPRAVRLRRRPAVAAALKARGVTFDKRGRVVVVKDKRTTGTQTSSGGAAWTIRTSYVEIPNGNGLEQAARAYLERLSALKQAEGALRDALR